MCAELERVSLLSIQLSDGARSGRELLANFLSHHSGGVDKVLRKVAGRGSQRGRAFETPHCQAGAPAREGSRGHYREALWLNKCQDELFHLDTYLSLIQYEYYSLLTSTVSHI